MGIYIAAGITTGVAVAFYGWLIAKLATPVDCRMLLLAFVIALPLQPLAFYAVRVPLNAFLTEAIGPGALLTALTLFYAPLTEEPAKWLPLAVPWVRRRLTAGNAVALALAIGLGFAIGEIWFLAHGIAQVPRFAALPFYDFVGFFGERLVVCFLHGAFIVYAVRNLAIGRSFLLGGLIGMALHFATNFPIFLRAIDLFGLGPTTWAHLIVLWIMVMLIVGAMLVERLTGDRIRALLLGQAKCPGCGAVYQRPWWAINMGPWRYERCPACRKFHWTKALRG
jgi:hypothetical protein